MSTKNSIMYFWFLAEKNCSRIEYHSHKQKSLPTPETGEEKFWAMQTWMQLRRGNHMEVRYLVVLLNGIAVYDKFQWPCNLPNE